ncbi:hypothetical protein FS815_25745 [Agrobacterium vitis]|uniref:hypothetical protein n=1 Tax=Allorhizobium ampelinum TaxID=3025782 RepID=UPI001F40AE12|nr:hypothetical protein [Allorhizobium ampelinum]MCF1450195.1 hypothetical protein [Allorhizobium ampelinum]
MINVAEPLTLKDAIKLVENSLQLPIADENKAEPSVRMDLITYEPLDAAENLEKRLYLAALMIADPQPWSKEEIDALKANGLI